MNIRLAAACAGSIVLAVAATLMPLPSLGAPPTDVAANQSAASGYNPSKPGGKHGAGKDANPSPTNASGLSDSDLAKRMVLRCRTRPQLCAKRRDVEPNNAVSDKQPPNKKMALPRNAAAPMGRDSPKGDGGRG
jgi:hypothetical protein